MTSYRPEYLIKFCTAEAGLQILRSASLRWSAPCRYQDPLELDHHSQLPFTQEHLLQAAVQAATSMLFAKEPPRGSGPLLNAIRRWRDEERFSSPEEANSVLEELMGQVVNQRLTLLQDTMKTWRSYACGLRICSFSSKPDNSLCWDLYGDQHRGLGIRFSSGDDSGLPPPGKVQYSNSRPEISTLNDEISAIIHATNYRASEHFEEKLTIKPDQRSEEREWRCFHQVDEPDNTADEDFFNDIAFEPISVTGIYFGLATPDQVKGDVRALLKRKYPHVKLFQADLVPGKYQLQLQRL